MLATGLFSLFLVSVASAAPSLELLGAPTPAKMYALAQRHARSTLSKRNECWIDTDCPVIANALQSTCNPTRCCDVHCKTGYTLVDGQCHQSLAAASSSLSSGCPSGKRLFNGVCVAAPATALSPRSTCQVDNDCTTGKGHAYPVCQNGACSIVCWQGYTYNGKYCAQTSGFNCAVSGCANGPAGSNLIGVCRSDGRCSSECAPGYVIGSTLKGQDAYRCYLANADPINKACTITCKKINFSGSSTCNNNKCTYTCSDSNKTPVLKSDGQYYCENLNNNTQCCGTSCRNCPSANTAYAGLSTPQPACQSGMCGFSCSKGTLKSSGGKYYCA